MPTRTARTAWHGTLQEGSGQVELASSKVGTYEVSFPKRAAEEADGTTSPEELRPGRRISIDRHQADRPRQGRGLGRSGLPRRRAAGEGNLPGQQGAHRRRDRG